MIRNLSAKLRAMSTVTDSTPDAAPEASAPSLWRLESRTPLAFKVGDASLEDALAASSAAVALMQPGVAWSARDAVFLDTETTGLSGGVGTLAFLVGMGWIEGDEFVVEQILIRDYHEEEAMLAEVSRRCEGRTLVTYNGRSYDAPLLRSRMIMNRVPPIREDAPHIDLLHAARRVYRMRLKKCALTDIERGALNMRRVNDLPGSEAPERFFRYLRTREEELVLEGARHNERDILSLAALLGRLARAVAEPDCIPRADAFGVGGLYERGGDFAAAERCYRFAAGRSAVSQEGQAARWALHRLYRRAKRPEEERAALLELIEAQRGGVDALIALSKVCEHRLCDYATALYAVDEALSMYVAEDERRAELFRRRERVLKRIRGVE